MSGIFPQLPVEIHQEVMDHVDGFPISLEEAKTLRLELMDERKAFVARHDEKFAEATFNLCEHFDSHAIDFIKETVSFCNTGATCLQGLVLQHLTMLAVVFLGETFLVSLSSLWQKSVTAELGT
jgi:hypothetical protein